MENREENRARDTRLDMEIDRLLMGERVAAHGGAKTNQVAREFSRLAAEESPRLSNAARIQGLNALRAGAAKKRARQRTNPFGFLSAVPRWAMLAAVALIVVFLANGVSAAAADSLPGSWLYPFKRFGEGGQLLLQNSSGQRAQLWMNLANTRLDEVQRLLAGGTQVDPSYLDAVDESILRALSELGGTRGNERVELLKQLTALAIRQQQILDQLAQNASPLERARLEQTVKLLQGVAGYAQSPKAADDPTFNPLQFLTPSPTPTASPTLTPTPLPTGTAVPPTNTAVPVVAPIETNATASPNSTDDNDETETPELTDDHDETETPDATDDHDETETPDATDDHDETETPDATDDHDETETPELTDDHDETESPEATDDHGGDDKGDDDNSGSGGDNDNGDDQSDDDNSDSGDHDNDKDDSGGDDHGGKDD